jgi:hypothetical protein
MRCIEKSADDISDLGFRLLAYFECPGKTATMFRLEISSEIIKLTFKEHLS